MVKLPRLGTPHPVLAQNYLKGAYWGTSDPGLLTRLLLAAANIVGGGIYLSDNMFTWGRNMSVLEDKAFMDAFEANCENESDRAILWRRYIQACGAFHCVQLEGDFVECGAYAGVGMKIIIDYLGGKEFPKTFWGYDLFEHSAGMLHSRMSEVKDGLYERVMAKFADYPQVKIYKGAIPEILDDGRCPEKISYLYIDMNQAPAEIAALDRLFDKVVPGGMIYLDDYEWAGEYRAQKLAEDVWLEARGYRVMPLPSGQGLIIKR